MKKQTLRLRSNQYLRNLGETGSLNVKKMIQPLFLAEGITEKEPIKGLPGVFRDTDKSILTQIESDLKSGVSQFLLFMVPKDKSDTSFPKNFYHSNINLIKKTFPNMFLWLDTCICSVTTTGHCCHFHKSGTIDLDLTLRRLSDLALIYADAGADGIAPSDMMDGRVGSHRKILDANGHTMIPIMSYSTKFKSNFYGPFRGAADSSPQFGDRSGYQLDVRDRDTAIHTSIRDKEEGADLLMVKPGMTAIDLIGPIKEKTGLPTGAYQVSGEYASLLYLANEGFLNFEDGLKETWDVFRRAGSSYLITYGARIAQRLYS
ncbi:porphobilinogen synthase [Leptospira harrisiae]|uniref:Delta-aminolevulinic acid dehydratase n=1 Tax=Leptospira harrisiae TaxID=2023189 RepID=A0A2N0AMK0_9LEPT|nr:porphobilinogen synthase [Leptospira harrisiae]PJZ85528.1 delta-aminolevulinic acid dehydratase [Leptospira harrisiae]PKA09064.1 delta-aminolevulinic acid dehydratase [Leptospira harrisiae]